MFNVYIIMQMRNKFTSAVVDSRFFSRTNSIKNEPEFFFCKINSGNSSTSIGARKLSRKEKSMKSSDVISNLSKTENKTNQPTLAQIFVVSKTKHLLFPSNMFASQISLSLRASNRVIEFIRIFKKNRSLPIFNKHHSFPTVTMFG